MTLYFAQPTPEAGTIGMLVSLAANPLVSLFGNKLNVETLSRPNTNCVRRRLR